MIFDNSRLNAIEIGSIETSSFQKFLTDNYNQSKIVILVDENTHDCCLEYLLTTFPDELTDAEIMLLPAGEENKVMEVCFQIFEALSEYKIGRKDLIINLGGGVVTDMGGFIAAIYKRGINFINIPTSFLAMIDAAIGGKVGIDLGELKNQLGTFYFPEKTYIDPIFLKTLSKTHKINGLAEALKAGVIYDSKLWKDLCELEKVDKAFSLEMLERIVNVKKTIVSNDPMEIGERKILNFGHTVGHAIEGYFLNENPIHHGHAVAIGMVLEAYISVLMEKITTNEYSEVQSAIFKWFPMISIQQEMIPALIELMRHDKKNEKGEINMALINGIGSCSFGIPVSESIIEKALMCFVID